MGATKNEPKPSRRPSTAGSIDMGQKEGAVGNLHCSLHEIGLLLLLLWPLQLPPPRLRACPTQMRQQSRRRVPMRASSRLGCRDSMIRQCCACLTKKPDCFRRQRHHREQAQAARPGYRRLYEKCG